MLPEKMIQASLSFVDGKHVQQPNVILVPAGAKTVPVTVAWSMRTGETYVIGSPEPEAAHRWCVLDGELKQVMHGGAPCRGKMSKKAEAVVGRTLHGGGAENPSHLTFELGAAKLKNGASYTLIASRHGVVAAGQFVAVHEPGPQAAKGKAKKAAGKGKAKK